MARAHPVDPRFLRQHVDRYWEGRMVGEWAGRHPMKGRSPGPGSVQLRSNDYLSIAGDQRIINAEISALAAGGHGEAVSRVWLHEEQDATRRFESRLAAVMQAEDAVLTSSGYTANLGLVQALAHVDTTIYIDCKAHMSLWEGVRSAGARARPFRHNDANHLERKIREHGAGIVLVDAVYSTDGAVCPLIDIVEAAEAGGCAVVVDETHSFGAHGPGGAGLVVAQGLADRVHFRTIGMSKAVAARGGAVICSRRNAEYFRYEALPAIFSTSVMQHEVAGYDAALDIFAAEGWRRDQLHANHRALKAALDALGYNVDASQTQIVALEAGTFEHTIRLRDALEERGVFGSFFLAPAVPADRCLIRFTLNASVTREQLDHVASVCAEIFAAVEAACWRSTRRRRSSALLVPSEPASDSQARTPQRRPGES